MKSFLFGILLLSSLMLVSCSSKRSIAFSNENWHFSFDSGNIVNSDSTLQFSFEDHILDPTATLISCRDSLDKYPGAESYIHKILSTCKLDNCTVFFFSPIEKIMWVELPDGYIDIKPQAISYNLTDEKPGTTWIWDDDSFDGNRKPAEIYSNTFINNNLCALIVVDKVDYGCKRMACLHIYQSTNKISESLKFQPWHWTCKGNLLSHKYSDILANWIDSRRETIFKNFRLGKQTDYRRNINSIRTELKDILRADQEPRNLIVKAWKEHPNDTLLHQSIARQILHNDSLNLCRICEILDNYPPDFGEENEIICAVIQHSNLDLQQKYLPRFIVAAEEHKLKGELVAVMQDRIACWSGKAQIYGSQGSINENGIFIPAPIEDYENVDSRRAAMGMIPLQEYIQIMSNQ